MNNGSRQNRVVSYLKKEREKLVCYVRRFIDDTAEWDGEDIVQDVMTNIFNRSDVTIPIENLSAYVYQALRNRITDYFRKKRDTVSLDGESFYGANTTLSDILPDPQYEEGSADQRAAFRQRLFRALSVLSEKDRALIIATELENRSFRALSEEWQVPLGTLLARKSRALHKMRRVISDMDK